MQVPLLITSIVLALQPTAPVTPVELAKKIEAMNVLLARDFETTFEMRVFPRRPADDESPVESDDWEQLEDFRYVAVGNKLYVKRLSYQEGDDSKDQGTIQYTQENTWADGAWTHRVSGYSYVSFFGQAAPPDGFSKGFLFNAMEGRFPSYKTLAQLVREGKALQQSVEDGVLTYRFAQSEALSSSVQHVIRARLEPAFELMSYAIEFARPQAEGSFHQRRYIQTTYTVLEWQDVGDFRLPKRAQLDTVSPQNVGTLEGPPWLWRALYTRQSFREIAEDHIDPDLFTVPLPIGTSVYDDRIMLSFEIGNTYLSLDGTLYQLDEPIMEHPGDRLGEMIQNATPPRPPSGASSLPTSVPGSAAVLEPTRSGFLRSRIVLAGLLGVGVAFLTLAFIRARRAYRKAA